MKDKLTFILVGAGHRGQRYTQNAYLHGNYEIVGVVEPKEEIRNYMRDHYHIPADRCFANYDDIFALGKIADFAMICTQDKLHFDPAMKAIALGYPLLLEKPVAPTPEECIAIRDAAEKKGVPVIVCHVLRYTPFAKTVRNLIDEGRLGKIMNISHMECVGNIHYTAAYVRGAWKKEAASSNMLLAKSCHDIDLLQWLLQSKCTKVQSFGNRSYYRAENCPEGAPKRCIEGCPHDALCPYSAVKIYRDFPFDEGGWLTPCHAGGNRYSNEEVNEWLRTSDQGICVFQSDNDVVDHQTVNLEYENGETVVFTVSAFNAGGRRIHIMGTKGELISTDFDTIELFTYCDEDPASDRYQHNRRDIIKTSARGIDQRIVGGHGGGDVGIMEDVWNLLCKGIQSNSISDIRTSVGNHITVFAAEYSRLHGGLLTDVEGYADSL